MVGAEAGRVSDAGWDGDRVHDRPGKAAVEDALLRDIDKDDGAALQVAFRRAPHVFDGAYLRAALEEV